MKKLKHFRKCPNCENKDLQIVMKTPYVLMVKVFETDIESDKWIYCHMCGALIWTKKERIRKDLEGTIIPDSIRWRNFKDEPPPQDGSNELEFLFDSGYDEWIPDIGNYENNCILTNARYIDDFGDPVWWRPIGPMPKMEES